MEDCTYPRIVTAMQKIMADNDNIKARVAKKLKTNATSVGQWLSGERFPSTPKSLKNISFHSGCTMEWLMGSDSCSPNDNITHGDHSLAESHKILNSLQGEHRKIANKFLRSLIEE